MFRKLFHVVVMAALDTAKKASACSYTKSALPFGWADITERGGKSRLI